jgi:ATP-dependent RNA helicase DDX52/ROK1
MQAIPALIAGRDVIACAATGSGKSGGFILPALIWTGEERGEPPKTPEKKKKKKSKDKDKDADQTGKVKTLLLAPTRELACQIHREVVRLGTNRPTGLNAVLLSKTNAHQISTLGGSSGIDVLVTTPMRLCGVLNDVDLSEVRLVALDEADRLLDGGDNKGARKQLNSREKKKPEGEGDEEEEEEEEGHIQNKSMSTSFVSQVDKILTATPKTAIRAMFSATMGPAVRELANTVLRNPVAVTHGGDASGAAGANSDIEQELHFVGKEEGKLVAIRNIISRGIKPPVLIFVQNKERALELYNELKYDPIRVDYISADKTQAARDEAIVNFR